jgi:paraquat-inducible protein B
MDATMNHALRKGTRFWIVEPGLEGGGLGGLLSGTYVAIAPGEGDETREFAGQEYPPVLAAPEAGKTIILEGQGAGSITVGAPVQFEGMRVGRVLGSVYDEKRGATSIHVFVVQRFANDVRQSTRFWRSGGLSLSFSGGGLTMGDASLTSIITPAIAFYTPDVLAGAPVAEGTRFELHESRAAAIAAADGPHLTYLTFFPGPIHGLKAGTPVQMKGVEVGRVRDVRLRYVQATGSLETPVTLEMDPRLLAFEVTPATTRMDLRVRMNDALARLVQRGLRARLATSMVLPGASAVSLDIVAPPGTGRLVLTHDPPIIPAASAGSGLEGALASLGDVANTIRSLPLREIAGHMRSAAQRVDALVSDPMLRDSLNKLNRSLTEVERIAQTTGQNIEPLIQSLRNAAASAEAAASRAEQLMGSSQRQNYDLGELVKELTRAAEAVRALASYLTENPDALLKGRNK